MRRVLGYLLVWLAEPEQLGLRRHFAVWLKRVLLPSRMRGIDFEQLNDQQDIDNMLAERVKDWTRDWKEQGLEEGRIQGREEGREEGRAEGLRVDAASSAELERWTDNLLDAASLDAVFRAD